MRRLREVRHGLQGTPGTGIHRAEGTLRPLRGLQPLRHLDCMSQRRDRCRSRSKEALESRRTCGEASEMNADQVNRVRSIVVCSWLSC